MKGNPDVIKVLNEVLSCSCGPSGPVFVLQTLEHAVKPMLGRYIVIDVAIDAWINSHRAVALQGGVEVAAALTEVVVGRVAQSEHRIFHGSEIKAVAMHQALPETRGIIGRFAVAAGAHHHQHAVGVHQHARLAVRHVSNL
jgi:hypothetical protein